VEVGRVRTDSSTRVTTLPRIANCAMLLPGQGLRAGSATGVTAPVQCPNAKDYRLM
jgi:hypothetical protein